MLLLTELHAVQRSPTARALMAYLGLVPTELVMATRGVFMESLWQQGGYPKLAASAPNPALSA